MGDQKGHDWPGSTPTPRLTGLRPQPTGEAEDTDSTTDLFEWRREDAAVRMPVWGETLPGWMLERENVDLVKRVHDLRRQLEDAVEEGAERGKVAAALRDEYRALQDSLELRALLDQLHPQAQEWLRHDTAARQQFLTTDCQAFVMSVDIRRSTALMLSAVDARQYAAFIAGLCGHLVRIVKGHFGVFDKFTGDGILAFFPHFYSGGDAGYHVLQAASECHEAFKAHYSDNRSSFTVVPQDAGLGIGVDYGKVTLLREFGTLTAVGGAVVWACRLGGAPSGATYVNEQAYVVLSERYGQQCSFVEEPFEVKHEGKLLVYRAQMRRSEYAPADPEWVARLVKEDAVVSPSEAAREPASAADEASSSSEL